MQRLRQAMRVLLERGQTVEHAKRTANQCRHLLTDNTRLLQ
jgi:hypothetical protein